MRSHLAASCAFLVGCTAAEPDERAQVVSTPTSTVPAPVRGPIPIADADGDGIPADDDCDDADATAGEAWRTALEPADFAHFCDGGMSRCVRGDVLLATPGAEVPTAAGLECLTRIEGDLWIGDYGSWGGCSAGSTVTSLAGLDGLRTVGGSVRIVCTALTDLTGLESLERVDGSLLIGTWGEDYPFGNDELGSVEGLGSLAFVGGAVQIIGNNTLTSLSGLDALASVGTLAGGGPDVYGDLDIDSNYALTSLDGLGGLRELGYSLMIDSDPALRSLVGLGRVTSVPGWLDVLETGVVDLHGLDGVASVGRSCTVGWDPALASVDGLDALTTIGENLDIDGNDSLVSLTGLADLSWVGGDASVTYDDALDPAVAAAFLDGIDHVGGSTHVYQ